MIFNPIFFQAAGQTETIDLPKQLKLNSPGYLFSDIIKIVGASSQNQNSSESLATANSIKLIQSGLQNLLQNLDLNQKSLSSDNKDLTNSNNVSVTKDIATIIQAIQDSLNPISSENKIIKKQSPQLIPNQVPAVVDNSIPSGNLNLLTSIDQQTANNIEPSINNINKQGKVETVNQPEDSANSQNKKFAENLLLSISSGNPIALNVSLNGSNYLIKFNPVDENQNISTFKNLSISGQKDTFNLSANKINLSNPDNSIFQKDNKTGIELLLKDTNIQTSEPKIITANTANDIHKSTLQQQPAEILLQTEPAIVINPQIVPKTVQQDISVLSALPKIKTTDTANVIQKSKIQQQPAEVLLQTDSEVGNNPLISSKTTHQDIPVQQTLSIANSASPDKYFISNLNILQNYFKTGKFNLQHPINKADIANINLLSGRTSIAYGTNSFLNSGLTEKSEMQLPSGSLSNTIKPNNISFSFINKPETNSGSQVITLNNNEEITALHHQPVSQNILVTVEKLNTPFVQSNTNQYEMQLPKAGKDGWIKELSSNSTTPSEIKIDDNKTADMITSTQPEANPIEKFPPDDFSLIDNNTIKANSQQLNQIMPKSNVVIQPDSIIKNMEELYSQNNNKQTIQSTNEPAAQIIAKPSEDQKSIMQNSQNIPITNADQPQNKLSHTSAQNLSILKNAGETKQDFSGDESFKQNDNQSNLQKSNSKKDIQFDSKLPDNLNFLHDLTSINKNNLPQTPITASSENIRTVKPYDLPNEIAHLAQSGGSKSVVLNLDPDALGKVKIVLDLTDKSVHANIQVDNEGAKQAVQNNINELKQSLNLNGLQLGSLNISLSNNDDKANKSFLQKKKSAYNQYNSKIEETENSISSKSLGYNTYDYLI